MELLPFKTLIWLSVIRQKSNFSFPKDVICVLYFIFCVISLKRLTGLTQFFVFVTEWCPFFLTKCHFSWWTTIGLKTEQCEGNTSESVKTMAKYSVLVLWMQFLAQSRQRTMLELYSYEWITNDTGTSCVCLSETARLVLKDYSGQVINHET